MLKNLVKETATSIGTGTTINLAGAATGYSSFLTAFGTGGLCFYFITDGVNWEAQSGTVTAGSPNTLSRGTPLATSNGVLSRINFTGTVSIYNNLPASQVIYADASNVWQAQGRRMAGLADATLASDSANLGQVGWKQIGAATNAGTTTVVQYTLPTTYTRYRVEFAAYVTAAQPVFARFSTDNGVTYKFGAADYTYGGGLLRASGYTGGGTNNSFIALTDTPVAGDRAFGAFEFDTTTLIGMIDSAAIVTGPVLSKWNAGFTFNLTGPITNVQVGVVSSTFAGVKCRLLGGF